MHPEVHFGLQRAISNCNTRKIKLLHAVMREYVMAQRTLRANLNSRC